MLTQSQLTHIVQMCVFLHSHKINPICYEKCSSLSKFTVEIQIYSYAILNHCRQIKQSHNDFNNKMYLLTAPSPLMKEIVYFV